MDSADPQRGVCSCGWYLARCSLCDRQGEPTRLELLAEQAGVHPYYVRRYLRRRISQELRRRLGPEQLGGFRGEGGKGSSLPYICFGAAAGDGLGALALAVDLLEVRAQVRQEEAAGVG